MTDKQDFEKLRREATPGPWVKDYGLTIGHIKAIINDGQRITPTVARYDVSSCDSEEQQANARFIASIHAIDDARIAAEARVAKLEMERSATCEWKQWDEGDTWETSCGEAFTFISGGPKENNVNYCHHCGKRLVMVSAIDAIKEIDDEE